MDMLDAVDSLKAGSSGISDAIRVSMEVFAPFAKSTSESLKQRGR